MNTETEVRPINLKLVLDLKVTSEHVSGALDFLKLRIPDISEDDTRAALVTSALGLLHAASGETVMTKQGDPLTLPPLDAGVDEHISLPNSGLTFHLQITEGAES